MVNKKLLFEIGVEDLPSKNLDVFSEKIKKSIEENFKKNSISFSSINNFYTNIRLVFKFCWEQPVKINNVSNIEFSSFKFNPFFNFSYFIKILIINKS